MSIFRRKSFENAADASGVGLKRSKGHKAKQLLAVTALGSLLATGISTPAMASNDIEVGPGVHISGVMDQGETWLGALATPANGDQSWLVYCINVGILASTGNYSSVSRISGQPNNLGQPAAHRITVPQLAAALHRFEASGSQLDRAALGYLVHVNFEEAKSAVPAQWRVERLVANTPQNVKNQAEQIIAWAKENTASEYNGVVVAGDGEQSGTVDNIGIKSEAGGWVAGRDVTVKLNGPAVFDETGTNTWTGVTKTSPFSLTWTGTGTGKVTGSVQYENVRTTLTKYHMGQAQDTISYGEAGGISDPDFVERDFEFSVTSEFQPRVRSEVSSKVIAADGLFQDTITAFVADGDQWIDDVPATFTTHVYRVTDAPAEPSAEVPADAVLIGSVDSTFTGPGSVEISVQNDGTAGRLIAQTVFEVASQPSEYQEYFTGDYKYDWGLENETATAQFTPTITTERDTKIITPGGVSEGVGPVAPGDTRPPHFEAYNAEDNTVTLVDHWTLSAPGMPSDIELLAEGTLYGPFSYPLPQTEAVPGDAPVAGSAESVFPSAGTQAVEAQIEAIPGTYTWVAGIDKDKQSHPELVMDSFVDDFMVEAETTIVRVPTLDHWSMAREYNVHHSGRAFDSLEIGGFPVDHGEFEGLGDFLPDLTTARVVIYDAGADRDWTATGTEIPADAVAVWEEEISSGNGRFEVGYDDANPATDFTPNHDYVFVYHFDGDDRVAPFHSDFNDVRERFHVPGPNEPVENPKIGTTLTGEEGEKVLTPGEKTTLVDTVCYEDLTVGQEYELTGVLMDKDTEKPIVIDGAELTSTITFTPKNTDGCAEVEFTFNSSALAGKDVVAFEYLYREGKLVAVHADIRDEGQTVRFEEFTPKTTLTGQEGEKVLEAGGEVTLIDTVCPPKGVNLSVGQEYELVLTIVDQATGEPLVQDGEVVTATATFTPETAVDCGSVSITFDSSDLAGKQVVAFEEVYTDGRLVGIHADLDDKDQTVEFVAESSGDGGTEVSEGGGLAVTGASGTMWLIAAGLLLAAGGTGAVLYQRRMKKNLQEN